jgi:RND family efflux transporter MFP subunit
MRFLDMRILLFLLAASVVHADPLAVDTVRIAELEQYQVERTYGGHLSHRRSSLLGFEFSGVINSVMVEEGAVLSRGDILLSIDSSSIEAQLREALANVATARANITAQKAQLELSRNTLKRYEDLVEEGHASAQQLDELRIQHRIDQSSLLVLRTKYEAADARAQIIEVNLAKTQISAPYNGVVQKRYVDEGSIVTPGQPVLSIVELGAMEARVGLPENMAAYVDPNRSYEFKISQKSVPGRLKSLLPAVDQETGTVIALFELDSADLYAGSLAEMKLQVTVNESGFWLPLTALAESQRGLWSVLVVTESTLEIEARLVEILHRGSDQVYVRGTLQTGDLVVSGGTSRIVPGQSVALGTGPTGD